MGVSFYITLIGSCFVYYYIAETIPFGIRNHGHEGDLKFGSVYTAMRENKLYNPVHWFVMFFSWTYLVIAIISVFKIKRSWFADVDPKALSVMMWVSIMAAVAGLLPTFFFSFNGANAMFFVAVQMFISGGFLMALGPTIQSAIARNKILIVSFFAACLVLLVIIHKKIRFTAKEILIENLNTRILISDRNAAPKVRFSLNHDLKVIANGFSDLQKKADSNKLYQVLKNAEKLGNQEDRQRSGTLLFIEDYLHGKPIRGTEHLNCLEKTFLIPALSGYAMLNGAIYNCSIESYGAAYYQYPSEIQDPATIVLCENAMQKGFDRILTFNVEDNTLQEVECKRSQD